ncbi:SAWADEE HOMEODOMAIN-like 1 [Spatholobus suberectus]|nr:SAWADEE HOMEODOMAIN-like 1 [Spatholobus suberectus]
MDKLGLSESPFPKLSPDEILELERIYKDMGERPLDRKVCQEIAKRFSSSSNGAAKTSLSWQQVQQWFKNRQRMTQDKDSSSFNLLKLSADLSDSSLLGNGDKSSSNSKGKQVEDLSELAFEARSTKDVAWHDVAMFLNYRVMSTGELEVRVRYAGFGKEQDEWMNVKQGVRERSVPLVPSECHKVKDGDLVLCFLEREDYALYCDARVVKIQRKLHDPTECTCTFIVRFVHDDTEEGVSWNRLCCRPTQEESAFYPNPALNPTLNPILNLTLNPIESLWG